MPASPVKQSPKAKEQSPKTELYTCDFCKKSYKQEKSFLLHMCEQKRRWLDQDSKAVKLGFQVFQRFHEINYKGQRVKTYEDFMKSNFYTAFTKFGRYLLHLNAINPKAFIDFLIRTEVKLSMWESPLVYEKYIRELNKKESPEAAIERNFLLMQQWANDNDEVWTDFFRKVEPAQAALWIKSGRISPWILFTASSASDLLARLSDEQLTMVQSNIDPDYWKIRLDLSAREVAIIREQLDEAGL
jgi:hypothetical protein